MKSRLDSFRCLLMGLAILLLAGCASYMNATALDVRVDPGGPTHATTVSKAQAAAASARKAADDAEKMLWVRYIQVTIHNPGGSSFNVLDRWQWDPASKTYRLVHSDATSQSGPLSNAGLPSALESGLSQAANAVTAAYGFR